MLTAVEAGEGMLDLLAGGATQFQGGPDDANGTLGVLLAGVPDRVIMAQLGHSQISTTAVYAHVVDSMLTDAAGLMDGMLTRVRAAQ